MRLNQDVRGDAKKWAMPLAYARVYLEPFVSNTVATFVQNVGLIWLKVGFLLHLFQDTSVIMGLTTGTET